MADNDWLGLLPSLLPSDHQLVTIMFSSIDYLTRKATFKQVVPSIPVTQEIPNSEKPEVFEGQSEVHDSKT